jgi:uncharacterized Zn finger protein (UPF0148 family)
MRIRSKTVKCPVCGSLNFFVKAPDDEYETYEFELKDDAVVYHSEAEASGSPDVKVDTEVFCEKCSWHDKFQELKNS